MLQGKSRGPERRENEVGGASYLVSVDLGVWREVRCCCLSGGTE